jgi:hypothetical protein
MIEELQVNPDGFDLFSYCWFCSLVASSYLRFFRELGDPPTPNHVPSPHTLFYGRTEATWLFLNYFIRQPKVIQVHEGHRRFRIKRCTLKRSKPSPGEVFHGCTFAKNPTPLDSRRTTKNVQPKFPKFSRTCTVAPKCSKGFRLELPEALCFLS